MTRQLAIAQLAPTSTTSGYADHLMTLPDGDLLATQTELGITVSLVPSNDPCCGGTSSGTIAAMAWVKIPVDNHPVFLAAVPKDPRVTTLRMFGGLAAKANGYMFGGLFARAAFVRLSPADQRTALALDGAEPFDPMGNGRVMSNMIMLPEAVMEEPAELRDWLARALAHTAGLPAKPLKPKLRAATKPGKPKQPKRAATKPGKPKQPAAKPGKPKRAAAKPRRPKLPKRAAAKPGKPKRAAAKPGRPNLPKRAAAKPGKPKRAAAKPGKPKRAAAKPGRPKLPKRAAAKPGKRAAAKPGNPKRAAAKPGQSPVAGRQSA